MSTNPDESREWSDPENIKKLLEPYDNRDPEIGIMEGLRCYSMSPGGGPVCTCLLTNDPNVDETQGCARHGAPACCDPDDSFEVPVLREGTRPHTPSCPTLELSEADLPSGPAPPRTKRGPPLMLTSQGPDPLKYWPVRDPDGLF